MAKFKFSIAVLALLGVGIVIAAESSYRLAGIIVPDNGSTPFAIIELPGGEQQLLRAGDSIQDGRVAEITADTVRLALSQGEVVLQLAGTGNPESRLPKVYRQADYTTMETKPVDPGKLGEISQLAATADKTESKALASRVLSYLNLPAKARIMGINDQAVESPAEAVRQMAASIDAKAGEGSAFQFVVSIADVSGNKRVYIFADNAGHITKQTVPAN